MLILIVAFSAASGGVYFMEESACQPVQLFFNTQMYETLCLHLISPLMQRAVTFPHKAGGWNRFLGIPHAELLSELSLSAPVLVKGEGGDTAGVGQVQTLRRVSVSGGAEG